MIAVDDETYDRAERQAERLHMSVPHMLESYLVQMAEGRSPVSPEEFLRLEKLQGEIQDKITNFSGADRLPRDRLYDRNLR